MRERDDGLEINTKHGSVLLADSHGPMLEGVRSLLEERLESVVMVADESSLLQTPEKLLTEGQAGRRQET